MRTKLRRRIFKVLLLLTLAGSGAVFTADTMVRLAARGRTYTDLERIPQRDVGLVLGCSRVLADGRDNLFFRNRIAAAVALYNAGKVGALIVSGDNHTAGYDEATDMKDALINAGVPAENIYCDYAGFRTLDSVVRAKHVFGQTRLTIVSQNFHNQRAIFIARRHGIDAVGFNAANVGRRHAFRTEFREQFACVKTVFDMCAGTTPKFLGAHVEISLTNSTSEKQK